MATEAGKAGAAELWNQLLAFFENASIKYESIYAPNEEGDYLLRTRFRGDDLPMEFLIGIDANRQVLFLKSLELVKVSEDKLPTVAMAVCAMNDKIFDGSYALSLKRGTVMFTYTIPFAGSLIHESVLMQMMAICNQTVDAFNDKLFALVNGMVDLDGFLKMINY